MIPLPILYALTFWHAFLNPRPRAAVYQFPAPRQPKTPRPLGMYEIL